jgi:hypothetical protein
VALVAVGLICYSVAMGDMIIKVSPELATALRAQDHRKAAELLRTLRAHGANLGRPTGTVGETRQYFSVIGVASERVQGLLEDLRRQPGVEAAYVKPSDALP